MSIKTKENMSEEEELPETLTLTTPLISEGTTVLPPVWGRLNRRRVFLATIELRDECYKFGRSPSCNINFNLKNLKSNILKLTSKEHFMISKDVTSVPYIKDLSKNGTYVNGILIGKGNMVGLCDGDIIAMGANAHEVYQYRDEPTAFISPEFDNKYKITRMIGKGAFGEVYLVLAKKSCQRYAVKKIKITKTDQTKITNEVRIMETLQHPCVIKMIEAIYAQQFVYIILDYMEGGELQRRVLQKGKLKEAIAKLYIYQIALAVKYLHTCGITHRDLKPENVLLATKEWNTCLKITDFGMSKIVGDSTLMRSLCGTPLYVAPEILKSDGRTATYTPQVDVWSLGCIAFFTLYGKTPFEKESKPKNNVETENDEEDSLADLFTRIKSGNFIIPNNFKENNSSDCCQDKIVSEDAVNLIKVMLALDPKKRFTIEQVLQDNWFQDQNMLITATKLLSNLNSG